MRNEIKTLSHSTYRYQYHIVFAPKFRGKEIYRRLKNDIRQIIRKLCEEKKAETCPDHIHMIGKSSLMIFYRHANLKYKYGEKIYRLSHTNVINTSSEKI